jgi:hypothetical protein
MAMKLIQCRRCNTSLSTMARACPRCGHPAHGRWNWLVASTLLVGVVATLVHGWYGRLDTERAAAEHDAALEGAEATHRALGWHYHPSQPVVMAGAVDRSATIHSTNRATMAFPYAGAQRASIVVRNNGSGLNVMFSLQRGHLDCDNWEECSITMKFDDTPATEYRVSESTDESSVDLIVENKENFVGQLAHANIVWMQAKGFQDSSPVFKFNVGGFSMAELMIEKPPS